LFLVGCKLYEDYFDLIRGIDVISTSLGKQFKIKKWYPLRTREINPNRFIFLFNRKIKDYIYFSEGIVILDSKLMVGQYNVSYSKLDTYFYKRRFRRTYEDYVKYDGSLKSYRGNLEIYRDYNRVYKSKGVYEIDVASMNLLKYREDKTRGDTNWYKQKMCAMKLPINLYSAPELDYQISYSGGVYKIYNSNVVLNPPEGFDFTLDSVDVNINDLPRKKIYPGMLIIVKNKLVKNHYYITKEKSVYHSSLESDSLIPMEMYLKMRKVLSIGDKKRISII
jgi:hypothetical protein